MPPPNDDMDLDTPFALQQEDRLVSHAPARDQRLILRGLLRKNVLMLKRNKKRMYDEVVRTFLYFGVLILLSFTVVSELHPAKLDFPAQPVNGNTLIFALQGACDERRIPAGNCSVVFADAANRTSGCTPRLRELMVALPLCKNFGCTCVSKEAFSDWSELEERGIVAAVEFTSDAPASVLNWTTPIDYVLHLNSTMLNSDLAYSKKFFKPPQLGPQEGANDFLKVFVPLQLQVEAAIVALQRGDPGINVSVQVQEFPYTEYTFTNLTGLSTMPYYMLLIFVASLINLTSQIVEEREKKLFHSMEVIGVSKSTYMQSWAIILFVRMLMTLALAMVVTMSFEMLSDSSFTVVLVYNLLTCVNLVSLAFLVISLCSKAKTAVVALIVSTSVMGAPVFATSGLLVDGGSSAITGGVNYGLCILSPPYAIAYGNMLLLSKQNIVDNGMQWSTVAVAPDGEISLAGVMLFLIVTSVVQFLLAIYFERVVPKDTGVYETDLLFCLRFRKKQADDAELSDATDFVTPSTCEEAPSGLRRAVEIDGMEKVFDSGVLAVNKLSLDFYEDQITSFLGHNGAGKSTTISLITGLYNITKGDTRVYGRSVVHELEAVQSLIGVCPQENVLWDLLTVKEHLELFAMLRGLDAATAGESSDTLLRDIGMLDKKETFSKNLSGGQKRKLCLCLALIGDPKVIFLDEPTAGMDAQARRDVWAMLTKMKKGRCIVLCTHHMDEAEILGDRIAVLSAGRLQAAGTSLYLKKHFALGFHLNVTLSHNSNGQTQTPSQIMALVRKYVPTAEFDESDGSDTSGTKSAERFSDDLSIHLPFTAKSSFPALLRALEQRQKEGGLLGYGLTAATLEDVFLRLKEEQDVDRSSFTAEEAEAEAEAEEKAPVASTSVDVSSPSEGLLNAPSEGPPSSSAKLQLLLGLQYRRSMKDKRYLACQILFPLVMVAGSVVLLLVAFATSSAQPPVVSLGAATTLNLGSGGYFELPYVCSSGCEAIKVFETWVNQSQPGVPTPVHLFNNSARDFDLALLKGKRPFAGAFDLDVDASQFDLGMQSTTVSSNTSANSLKYKLHYNTSNTKSIPALVSLMNSAFLAQAQPNTTTVEAGADVDEGPALRVSYQTLPQSKYEKDQASQVMDVVKSLVSCFLIVTGFIQIASLIAQRVVKDKETKAKHMQLLMGVKSWEYWLGQLLWDYFMFLIPAILGMLILALSGVGFAKGTTGAASFILLLLFGFTFISLIYLWTFAFENAQTAQTFISTVFIMSHIILFAAYTNVALLVSNEHTVDIIKYIICMNPSTALVVGLQALSLYDLKRAADPTVNSPFEWHQGGTAMCILAISGLLYFGLVLLLEHRRMNDDFPCCGVIARAASRCCSKRSSDPDTIAQLADESARLRRLQEIDLEDDDVKRERNLAYDPQAHVIRFAGVRKRFHARGSNTVDTIAVKDLRLCVRRGECFALLGTNGAGKSTALGMLLRDCAPTRGNAFINGHDVSDPPAAMFSSTGYCPQSNALFDKLTGRQVLTFFSGIRGVMIQHVDKYVAEWLVRTGLEEYADRACGKYSGGNKRKLSLAIAFCGNPILSILDEPSAGMDPAARRRMWCIINKWRRSGGQNERTVVLTTHYMDEADKLGSRIGIMVSGQLVCLGSSQHLKGKYGAGYTIQIKCKQGQSVEGAIAVVESVCPVAKVTEQANESFVQMSLGKQEEFPLPDLFETMEQRREELSIEAYSIGQSSMEQVFLKVAECTEGL